MLQRLRFMSAALLFSIGCWAQGGQTTELEALKQLAGQGNALAQAKVGALYHLGQGVDQNEEEAVNWMLKAAEQNFVDAEIFVAAMYERGMGVPQDIAAATQWYERAAAQGHETAQGLLGKYKMMRMKASAQIPNEYAKKILRQK